MDLRESVVISNDVVKVFDMVYLNGMSLIHKSTRFRKRNMRSCVKEKSGRIEFVLESEGKTSKDVRERMLEIFKERGEGLVLKHQSAEYVLNGRNKDWIKVSQIGHLVNSLFIL